MESDWDRRVAELWSEADTLRPEVLLDSVRELCAERPRNDPDALFELASAHDFLGEEHEAIPLYRASIAHGLSDSRLPRAVIQLASSLRNVGDPESAIELLRKGPTDDETRSAAQAFLALALRDTGRHDEALSTALLALSRTLSAFSRSVEHYASELE